MTENTSAGGAGAAGDPVQTLLLGVANQIDQLAGLIAGATASGATGPNAASPIPDLLGEVGTLVKELGDLLARIIAALVAVLEAVADVLRSDRVATDDAPSRFETISVTVTPAGH
ncbi:hypothetical protein [Gordonia shandongensis]|uniref:hypothetical protein n=1 Tax=Gordonia shandongensis TaxID=376351 RepID=UPI0003FC8E88|nr:hypothetical protein [Gordonia shandongensis]